MIDMTKGGVGGREGKEISDFFLVKTNVDKNHVDEREVVVTAHSVCCRRH